jgi:hypothetical protein
VREGVNGVCEINAGAVAGVCWIRAKAVNSSQYARSSIARHCRPAVLALVPITVELLLDLGDESGCLWKGQLVRLAQHDEGEEAVSFIFFLSVGESG